MELKIALGLHGQVRVLHGAEHAVTPMADRRTPQVSTADLFSNPLNGKDAYKKTPR